MPSTAPMSATASTAAVPALPSALTAGNGPDRGGPAARRRSCRYRLTTRVTTATAKASAPAVSVRRPGMAGQ